MFWLSKRSEGLWRLSEINHLLQSGFKYTQKVVSYLETFKNNLTPILCRVTNLDSATYYTTKQ